MLRRSHQFVCLLPLAIVLASTARTAGAAEPVEGAQVDARRQKVGEAVVAAMHEHGVPGASVAVFNDYRIDWADGYGVRSASGDERVTPRMRFQAASISKPVTAVATLKLVEQGRLDLDAKVNDLLKAWQIPESEVTQGHPVLLRHLLSHSAGLTVHGFDGYQTFARRPTLLEVLDGREPANSPPIRPLLKPGYKFRYSGGGYCVLQQLLLDTVGTPFPVFMRAEVLEPLEMTHSTYEQPLPKELASQAAVGHQKNKVVLLGGWHVYPEMAAAGLWTTPGDLARLAIDVAKSHAGRDGKLLSRDMARKMLTRENAVCGLGFFVKGEGDRLWFGHGGANEGYRCDLIAFPATGQGMAIMTNSDTGDAMFPELKKLARELYAWPDAKE